MKAPMVSSAAPSWMKIMNGLTALGIYSGNHMNNPESNNRNCAEEHRPVIDFLSGVEFTRRRNFIILIFDVILPFLEPFFVSRGNVSIVAPDVVHQ